MPHTVAQVQTLLSREGIPLTIPQTCSWNGISETIRITQFNQLPHLAEETFYYKKERDENYSYLEKES